MHIADVTRNNLGANGIVGGGIGLAMGVGLAIKLQKRDQVVLGIFGDGASNQGIFHEALNMAAIYKLPVVYLCENNQYADEHGHQEIDRDRRYLGESCRLWDARRHR